MESFAQNNIPEGYRWLAGADGDGSRVTQAQYDAAIARQDYLDTAARQGYASKAQAWATPRGYQTKLRQDQLDGFRNWYGDQIRSTFGGQDFSGPDNYDGLKPGALRYGGSRNYFQEQFAPKVSPGGRERDVETEEAALARFNAAKAEYQADPDKYIRDQISKIGRANIGHEDNQHLTYDLNTGDLVDMSNHNTAQEGMDQVMPFLVGLGAMGGLAAAGVGGGIDLGAFGGSVLGGSGSTAALPASEVAAANVYTGPMSLGWDGVGATGATGLGATTGAFNFSPSLSGLLDGNVGSALSLITKLGLTGAGAKAVYNAVAGKSGSGSDMTQSILSALSGSAGNSAAEGWGRWQNTDQKWLDTQLQENLNLSNQASAGMYGLAKTATDDYNNIYRPAGQRYADVVNQYGDAGFQEAERGKAYSTVAQQNQQALDSATRRMNSMGINPNSGAFGAMQRDNALNIAKQKVAAGAQSDAKLRDLYAGGLGNLMTQGLKVGDFANNSWKGAIASKAVPFDMGKSIGELGLKAAQTTGSILDGHTNAANGTLNAQTGATKVNNENTQNWLKDAGSVVGWLSSPTSQGGATGWDTISGWFKG